MRNTLPFTERTGLTLSLSKKCILLLGCLLTGCVTQSGDSESNSDNWQLRGKVAVTSASESRVLGIDWRHAGDRSVLDVSGPLGISVAHVEANGDRLTITTSEGVTYQSNDLSMVLLRDEKVTLPWRDLSYWVRGMTAEGEPIGPGGHASGAWEVRIVKKDESGPRLIQLNHPLATLRLQIRDWR